MYISIPPGQQDVTRGLFFKQSLTGLNFEFSFSEVSYHSKVKEYSLPYYLPIAGRRRVGFILLPRIFTRCEM